MSGFNETKVCKKGVKLYGTPQEYGAQADGVTDDSIAFKAMFAAGIRLALIPKGTYLINSPVFVPVGATIVGESRQHTVLINGTGMPTYGATLDFKNCTNAVISNLTLDGNINNVPGDIYSGVFNMRIQTSTDITVKDVNFINNKHVGCNVMNAQRVYFANCYFSNIDSGINGTNGTTNDTIRISNCTFDGHSKSEPIALYNSKNLTIEHCKMLNKAEGHAIALDGSQNVLVDDCYVYNCNDPFVLNSKNGTRASRIRITNCVFDLCTNGAIMSHSDYVEVSNCTFTDQITNITDCTNVDFINNKFIASTKACMVAYATTASDKLRFINNTIDNTNSKNFGTAFFSIYSVAITNVLVEKNTFINGILVNTDFAAGSSVKLKNNYDGTGALYTFNKLYVTPENTELLRVVGLAKPVSGYHKAGAVFLYSAPSTYLGGVNTTDGYASYATWSSGMTVWAGLQIKLSNNIVVKATNGGTTTTGTEPTAVTVAHTDSSPYTDANGIKWAYLGTPCNFRDFGAIV